MASISIPGRIALGKKLNGKVSFSPEELSGAKSVKVFAENRVDRTDKGYSFSPFLAERAFPPLDSSTDNSFPLSFSTAGVLTRTFESKRYSSKWFAGARLEMADGSEKVFEKEFVVGSNLLGMFTGSLTGLALAFIIIFYIATILFRFPRDLIFWVALLVAIMIILDAIYRLVGSIGKLPGMKKLWIATDSASYSRGDEINGRVIIRSEKPMRADSLTISLSRTRRFDMIPILGGSRFGAQGFPSLVRKVVLGGKKAYPSGDYPFSIRIPPQWVKAEGGKMYSDAWKIDAALDSGMAGQEDSLDLYVSEGSAPGA
jgi:hypothetical protein